MLDPTPLNPRLSPPSHTKSQRGWRVGHLLHFAFRTTGDGEAGTGQGRRGQAASKAASLTAYPVQSGTGALLPLLLSPAVVRPVFANGVDEFCERARQGRPEGPQWTRQGAALSRRRGSTVCVAGRSVSIGVALRASECPGQPAGRCVPRRPRRARLGIGR
jgi:hypothetical protein